ncbi:MAG: hypothetical protein JO063_07130 [Pseudonocardiales bacterium]|nr:hypothetical protein [Pseudonocardiales bacterium]MBV9029140.1 hypothetical protein [Pseudonocardiales bacterium]MBW0009876.1 hypothetical protein [Pseudonocardiales bacterium]
MAAYLMTRGTPRPLDYRFLGASPPKRWWAPLEDWIELEQAEVVVHGGPTGACILVSGIPSARRDVIGTVIRFTLVVDGADPGLLARLAAAGLDPAARTELGSVLDAQFPTEWVDAALAGTPPADDAVDTRLTRALEATGGDAQTTDPVGSVPASSWVGAPGDERAVSVFLDRVARLGAGADGWAFTTAGLTSVDGARRTPRGRGARRARGRPTGRGRPSRGGRPGKSISRPSGRRAKASADPAGSCDQCGGAGPSTHRPGGARDLDLSGTGVRFGGPQFDLDVVDSDGVRWFGMIRLFPPLLEGSLSTERGDCGHDVSGRVVGRRSDVFGDVVNTLMSRFIPPPPWAVAHLRFDQMRAEVSFCADSSQPEHSGVKVVELDPHIVPWLRSFVDKAARDLRAHAPTIGSVATAWELAWLHLVFGELEGAAEAAMRSVELLESWGLRPEDPAAGLRLIDQFGEFNREDVVAALRAALSD